MLCGRMRDLTVSRTVWDALRDIVLKWYRELLQASVKIQAGAKQLGKETVKVADVASKQAEDVAKVRSPSRAAAPTTIVALKRPCNAVASDSYFPIHTMPSGGGASDQFFGGQISWIHEQRVRIRSANGRLGLDDFMQDLANNAQPTADTVSAKVHAGADATEEEVDKAAKQTAETIDDGGAAAADSTRSGGKQLGDMVGA